MGLRTNDGKRRKAFGAYRTMTEQIGDYTLVRQVIGQDHPTSGVQAYLFRGAKDNKLVIWNIDGEASVALDHLENAKIEVRDTQGESLTVNRSKDGLVRLVARPAPIYVAGVPANVSLKLSPKSPRNFRTVELLSGCMATAVDLEMPAQHE
jgi:hypothetical protein